MTGRRGIHMLLSPYISTFSKSNPHFSLYKQEHGFSTGIAKKKALILNKTHSSEQNVDIS